MNDESVPFDEVVDRIADLAETLLQHHDPAVADTAGELLDWVDALHRDGVGRLVEMVREWRGEIFLEAAARDPVVGPLFSAYGLGEAVDVRAEAELAVESALDTVRPLVESHGGSLAMVSVVDGVVTVDLAGTCDGCPSADATLVHGVAAALRDGWPHFRRLELAEPPSAPDPAKADLECVPVSAPEVWQPVQIQGRR